MDVCPEVIMTPFAYMGRQRPFELLVSCNAVSCMFSCTLYDYVVDKLLNLTYRVWGQSSIITHCIITLQCSRKFVGPSDISDTTKIYSIRVPSQDHYWFGKIFGPKL